MCATLRPPDLTRAIRRAIGVRRDALLALSVSLEAVNPRLMTRKAIRKQRGAVFVEGRRLELDSFRHILVVGGGKASALMAVEVEKVFGERIADGVVVIPESQQTLPRPRRVRFAESTHPVPTAKGVRATEEMLRVLHGAGRQDLVVCLISGGGSALMPLPVKGVKVADLAKTTKLLLRSGAEIGEVNCVRKHLSQISGGRLAEKAHGARVLSLIVSDVVGNDFGAIASGPTAPDQTTFSEARQILKKRGIWAEVPASVRVAIQTGVRGGIAETPKRGSPVFARVSNILVGSNRLACAAAKSALVDSGYKVTSFHVDVTGEASVLGTRLAKLARNRVGQGKWAAVWGGETTVTVRGNGVGGRNQEVALAAAIGLRGAAGTIVASFGTDGIDGPTTAAGAIADSTTYKRAVSIGLNPEEYLERNDSYTLFKSLGDLVITGSTGTNVGDVIVALAGG